MPEIRSGFVNALYLFDVAEAIDLGALKTQLGASAAVATLGDKTPGPLRLQYAQAPLVIGGEALGAPAPEGFRVRVKFFDYGVIALALSQPFSGGWSGLLTLSQSLVENEALEQHAGDICRRIVERVVFALHKPRGSFLSEDYLVFAVTEFAEPVSADAVMEQHGTDIAQVLRGERQTLSRQEREEILTHRLSYLSDDLVVAAWNAAFVCDTEAGALATTEILEFANSQLLEFRYHDELLDSELTHIYAELQQPRWFHIFAGRRHSRETRRMHSIFIDVNELTDRTENAVKFVGDIYSARVFGIVSARLGLQRWKNNVEEKLRTLNDIHRFAVEQTGMAQGNFLELVIVLILLIEFGMLLAGIVK
jgi:hypothetical protein